MKKSQITVGETYVAKISGKLTSVRITAESPYGGWDGKNTQTGRKVRIKTAAKLRYVAGRSQRETPEQTTSRPANGLDKYSPAHLRIVKPWDFWEGRTTTSGQTGEKYIETPSTSWANRLKIWRVMYANCKQQGITINNCPCPSPMPYGHLMFN